MGIYDGFVSIIESPEIYGFATKDLLRDFLVNQNSET